MLFKTAGNKYDFVLETINTGIKSDFSILAIDKKNKRCSSINNLNLILGELDIDYQDRRFDDSSWVLPYKLVNHLFHKAKKLLLDIEFLKFLENYLDLDREQGEWENR
ncbi:hypothetical protein KAW65_01750 [candidate division WOR-3 bacterium]|nr:hypothetical protein [candidate division WOR-3 bacterium]